MRQFRRIGGTALAGLLLTAVVGGPAASAQTETKTPETYVGSAAGRVLTLKVGTNGLTAGTSNVSIDSTLKAVAQGTGVASPLFEQTTAKLEQTGEGVKTADRTCASDPLALPTEITDVLSIGAACSSATAAVQNGLPKAVGTGEIVGVDLDLSVLTSSAGIDVETLAPILDPLLGGVGELESNIEAALTEATGTPTQIDVTDTIAELTQALVETKTLEVDLGNSVSETVSEGAKVTSTATAAGGTIKLFPLGALNVADGVTLEPIVEVIVGSAKATAVYDRATGKSTPSFDPAILTIKVNTPLTNDIGEITGFDLNQVVINPNLVPSQLAAAEPVIGAVVKACSDAPNEFCILEGTPVETRIAVASGRTVTNADGSVGAIADAVKIQALKGIGVIDPSLEGGILLELAHAEAGVGGAPAQLITIAAPEVPRELPRTGGPAVLPMIAVAGLGIALAARRTIARASR